MTAVRRDLLDKIFVEHQINLVNQPYFILLEIRELDWQSNDQEEKRNSSS